jgi:small conductance mechanosensitive channel
VIDVPVPSSSDVNEVNETLREVGRQAFRDAALRKLLLDEPSVMGVESLGLDQVNVRLVARTLPGKQFEVGRDLRARIVLAFRRQGLTLPPSPQDTLVFDGDGAGQGGAGREADGAERGDGEGARHAPEPAAGAGETGR